MQRSSSPTPPAFQTSELLIQSLRLCWFTRWWNFSLAACICDLVPSLNTETHSQNECWNIDGVLNWEPCFPTKLFSSTDLHNVCITTIAASNCTSHALFSDTACEQDPKIVKSLTWAAIHPQLRQGNAHVFWQRNMALVLEVLSHISATSHLAANHWQYFNLWLGNNYFILKKENVSNCCFIAI